MSSAIAERKRARAEWPRIAELMRAGHRLVRDKRTKRYYADGMGSFTESSITMLREQGKIVLVDTHTYDLTAVERAATGNG